jgi:hypothetical protein
MKKALFFIILFDFLSSLIFAHPGRTDKNGGHNGPNGYHYHSSGSSSSSRSSNTKSTPAPQEVTTVIYEGNDFQEALNKFLSTCDTLEKELPYFQSLGIGNENSIKRNSRYYVYKTARSNNTLVRFNNLSKEKRVTMIYAKNNKSFNSTENVFQYPNERSRELANNWVIEIE